MCLHPSAHINLSIHLTELGIIKRHKTAFNPLLQQFEHKYDSEMRACAAERSDEWKINEENPKVITPFTWTTPLAVFLTIIIHLSEVIMTPGPNAFSHH